MSVEVTRRLFTADEFHRMGEAGIFAADDRLELLDGEILEMTPIGPSHASVVDLLTERFVAQAAGRVNVRVQSPVRLDDRSEPVPDLCLLHRRDDFYRNAHPRPPDVHLIVEVADSSTRRDRLRKVPRYARAGIPEVWLVDLVDGKFEAYRRPSTGGYEAVEVHGPGDTVRPAAFPEIDVIVAALFA